MANKLQQINPFMARFQNQVAMIEEGRAEWLQSCLAQVAEKSSDLDALAAVEQFWFDPDDTRSYYRPYKVKDGVLMIPVRGVLLNNFPYALGDWATGYEYIWQAAKRGAEDSNVKGIAFVIDSGGGMVAGNFDLNDRLYSLRGSKPMHSFANEHAYSAAYSIATCADKITVARTGGVGSIGVVVVHMEMSKMLESYGITTTIIRSKPGKMEGNSYEQLSEGALTRIQERVDEFHNDFAALVARNRGLSVEAVDETGALTFMPQQAIDNGLADEVGNFDDAFSAFVASFNPKEDEPMADYTKAQHDELLSKAVADATATAKAEGMKEGREAGLSEGAAAERNRITAIVGSEEGKKRPKAAMKMATNEKLLALDAEAIGDLLADMAVETQGSETQTGPGAPKGMLKDAMGNPKNQPNITVETDDDEDDKKPTRAEKAAAMVKA